MKMLDLEPIKARLAAATPGPWRYRNTCERVDTSRPVCEVEHVSVVPLDEGVKVLPGGQDLNLIVNAPRDLAALVAEVERLRDAKLTLKDALYELIKQFRSDDVMSIEAALHAAERVLEDA